MRTFEWAIEDIVAAYPSLSLSEFAGMAVAAMKPTGPPCEFLVRIEGFVITELDGESEFCLRIAWNQNTAAVADRIVRTKQRVPIIEGAAVALAALLFVHMIQDSDMEVTRRQQRADFLLKKLHCALEISGTEHVRELLRRFREKRRQVLENAFGLAGYVVICCFEDGHRMIRWSYHPQPE